MIGVKLFPLGIYHGFIPIMSRNFNDREKVNGYEVIRELGANRGAGRIVSLGREIDSEQLVVIKGL